MGTKYNRFAVAVDQLAKSRFSDYLSEKVVFDVARDNYESFPEKTGASADYAAKAAEYKAKYLRAEADFKRVKAALLDSVREVDSIRSELEKAIADAYKAKPGEVDAGVATLLAAGIMTEREYSDLVDGYLQSGNFTMARLTGAAAAKAAERSDSRDEQQRLRNIGHRGMDNPAGRILANFDSLRYAYERTAKNPSMIKSWEQLTAETIQNF